MKRIQKKLHSRSGASILLALLMMLVAAAVSAVIVSASVTTAKRVHDDGGQTQNYLTVNSASRLIMAYLTDENVYKYHTLTYEEKPSLNEDTPKVDTPSDVVKYLSMMAESLNPDEPDDYKEAIIKVSAPTVSSDGLADPAEDVPTETVTMNFRMEKGENEGTYSITGKIYQGSDPSNTPQQVFVSCVLTCDRSKSEGVRPSDGYDGEYKEIDDIDSPKYNEDGEIVGYDTKDARGTRHFVEWTLNKNIQMSTKEGAV